MMHPVIEKAMAAAATVDNHTIENAKVVWARDVRAIHKMYNTEVIHPVDELFKLPHKEFHSNWELVSHHYGPVHAVWLMHFHFIDEEHRLDIRYSQAEDYPVDLYYLMDLSKSMEDDKEKLSKLGDLLSDTMRNITSNFRLGFGSYVDKVLMPYVSTVPKKWVFLFDSLFLLFIFHLNRCENHFFYLNTGTNFFCSIGATYTLSTICLFINYHFLMISILFIVLLLLLLQIMISILIYFIIIASIKIESIQIEHRLLHPCDGCEAPYGYRNHMTLSNDTANFSVRFSMQIQQKKITLNVILFRIGCC